MTFEANAVNSSANKVAVAIVGKIPRAGTCKTRLMPPLSEAQATRLGRAFFRDTAQNVRNVAALYEAQPVALYFGSAAKWELDALFAPGFTYLAQRGVDLGERLANGAADLFERGSSAVCLLDADAPTLPPSTIARALHILSSGIADVVIGETPGGNYVLLGMRAFSADLFRDIPWGTAAVARQTRLRADAAGLSIALVPPWYDVDDGDGLGKLIREYAAGVPGGGFEAPATRAVVTDYLKTVQLEAASCVRL